MPNDEKIIKNTEINIAQTIQTTPAELYDFLEQEVENFQNLLRNSFHQFIFIDQKENKFIYEIFKCYKKLKGIDFNIFYGWKEKEKLTTSFFVA